MFEAAIAAAAAAAPTMAPPAPVVPGLELHVDGDYLAYYAAGNDETTAGESRLNATSLLEAFRSAVGATKTIVHNTAKGCQKGERYLIATVKPYQGQRTSDHKPKNHGYLQDWLMSYEGPLFRSKNWATREADDGIGACAHYAVGRGPGYIAIATADKDLRMLPGLHIDWLKRNLVRVQPGAYDVVGPDIEKVKDGVPYTERGKQYGLKFFFAQLLMGDQADNCPGLPEYRAMNAKNERVYKKMGEKTAYSLLDDCPDIASAVNQVCDLYFENYHREQNWAARRGDGFTEWADRLAEQAALMWMRLDNAASVSDFATHNGHSKIAWPAAVLEAAQRLEERVTLARQTLNFSGSDYDPLCADRAAA